eukprot:7386605-Prymnesium_polylepis.1
MWPHGCGGRAVHCDRVAVVIWRCGRCGRAALCGALRRAVRRAVRRCGASWGVRYRCSRAPQTACWPP